MKQRIQHGNAIVLATLMMLLVSVLVSAFLMVVMAGVKAAQREHRRSVAFHLAEAGAHAALAHLASAGGARVSPPPKETPLGDGVFTTQISRRGNAFIIRAVGKVPSGGNGTIEKTVVVKGHFVGAKPTVDLWQAMPVY
jgi:type II secretory pathway component PulK